MSLNALWQQFFPPAPTFTEKDVPPGSQGGKVFIVTGTNSGVGFELVKLLYPSGATVYLAGRSREKIEQAISAIQSCYPGAETPATLRPLHLYLDDLTTVKPAVTAFASQERGLRILWNNAGMGCTTGSSSKQGLESHIGANCVAPLLFTKLLLPYMKTAAKTSNEASVRIVWTGSVRIEMTAPAGGVDMERMESGRTGTDPWTDYAASKAGNLFLAHEAAQRWCRDGIVNVCENPGNLLTRSMQGRAGCPWPS
ncbi:NAD(P)-binding protein [Trematosphaeria pertusa]|uniref:NAD(P)-binding protein n=1 Tax=Trematosphaeria pertusa TaxID=390896 RepID=A0A6A6ITT5_9PLEO|nr:NAD(P)-binding protein [Trematosphaeria pertusa]KAF2253769.1 NAD(P)-binding protein [Trematosphaeria pertusa]